MSIDVYRGELVGLIGPNGAGKTTTFELLSGFVRPDHGRTLFDGVDVSFLRPEQRAKLGLVRSFQDAALFPTMTVTETVMVSLERARPSRLLPAVVGWSRRDREKRGEARELVGRFGLERYCDRQIQQLSTGTRRIVEIVCLVALRPELLLLDEPSSGIAQRDTEALGSLLASLNEDLGMTLVVIEHDIPLITGIAGRIVAMADGKVIADGTPAAVQKDPQVIEAYLGGSIAAIGRSGGPAASSPRPGRRVAAGGK